MKCCCCLQQKSCLCPFRLPSCCQRNNRISPCDTLPKSYEMMKTGSNRNIRVAHLKPGVSQVDSATTRNTIFTPSYCDENLDSGSLMSDSSLEDCFVKHWAKPHLRDIHPGAPYSQPKRTEPQKKLGPQLKKDRALSKFTQNSKKKKGVPATKEVEKFIDGVIQEAIRLAYESKLGTLKLDKSKEGYVNEAFSASSENVSDPPVIETESKQDCNVTSSDQDAVDSITKPTEVIPQTSCTPDLIREATSTNFIRAPSSCKSTPVRKKEEKPLIFFIHGVGGSSDVWTMQLSYFVAVGFEVIAPDLLGHGFSGSPDSPAAYKFPKLLNDVLHIFDAHVTKNRKVVMVGHSYGCSFVTAIARKRPENVILLVLIASGGPAPLSPSGGIFNLPVWMMGCLKPFMFCGFKREAFYSPRWKRISFTDAYHIPPYVLHHIMQGQDWPEGDVTFHRRITVPTLLVYGLKDPFVTLVEECEMERTIPHSYLEVIPTAGHMVMLEAPHQICHLIHKFILCWEQYLAK